MLFVFLVMRGNVQIVIHFYIQKIIHAENKPNQQIHLNDKLPATLTVDIQTQETRMKILLWVILIIFLIGLLVVTGVFKMIF